MSHLSLTPSPFGVKVLGIDIPSNTVTVTESTAIQPPAVCTVMVYNVVDAGLARGFKILLLSKPVNGLHVISVIFPHAIAVNATLLPFSIVLFPPPLTTGNG